ncbi:hypothetical protein DFH09DRAFT_1317119 [Mycena vulgaris]|nr:hypothetical protein DFH09DRAFT_1317119 [Mycena vulgaris]
MDSLLDMEVASRIMSSLFADGTAGFKPAIHPMDARLDSLMLSNIAVVPAESGEWAAIAKYSRDTEVRKNSKFELDVESV